jgi:hypothetical protein
MITKKLVIFSARVLLSVVISVFFSQSAPAMPELTPLETQAQRQIQTSLRHGEWLLSHGGKNSTFADATADPGKPGTRS